MRLVQTFWRICGIFTIDLTYNKFQYVFSVLLMATCVYNYITASETLCKLDHSWCEIFSKPMTGMYTRVLAFTTFLSRIAIVVQSKHHLFKYKATIKAFEIYSPTSTTGFREYKLFSFVIVFLCLVTILPINISRLYHLYYYETHNDNSLLVYYLFIYIQNLSMCCIETQFVSQCFIIYIKFREINGDMKKLKDENFNYDKYPFIMGFSAVAYKDYKTSLQCVRYDKDFYKPPFVSHPMANTVEIFRIKHWLTRQAVDILNNLFGFHMGLSVFLLWVMALFDIYYEIFRNAPSKILVYCWLLQYCLRMFMIILIPHYTTKQAMKSKSLIADTNNRMLDNSTKDEAIAAGLTYLVILIRFHS
ncbi:Hypothetical protein CINCED_3A025342 [Cinara cedri]|uniref:Gustatory receptor n=1 Tax=Cinara cedri TaxID=506608 RepID=A0A5E4M6E0_9HEMI|nr:Hypothetical protein CINCED_3A025342 [Cinara cedri]